MRVPLDQSGAAATARWMAASGLRPPSARVSRVSRVAKTNASAGRAAGDRRSEQVEVRPGVRLHRPRDVAEQDEPPRAGPSGAAGERHRVAAGAQAAAQRASQVEVLSAPGAAPPPRAAPRGGELQRRHHATDPLELLGLEGLEALLPQALRLARGGQRDLDLPLGLLFGGRRGGPPHPARGLLQLLAGHRAGLRSGRAIAGPRAAQRRRVRVAPLLIRLQGGVEHRREHPIEGRQLGLRGDEDRPRRPVELRSPGRARPAPPPRRSARRVPAWWAPRQPAAAGPAPWPGREGRSCRAQARPLTAAARPCPASPPRRGPGSAACRCAQPRGSDTARRRRR